MMINIKQSTLSFNLLQRKQVSFSNSSSYQSQSNQDFNSVILDSSKFRNIILRSIWLFSVHQITIYTIYRMIYVYVDFKAFIFAAMINVMQYVWLMVLRDIYIGVFGMRHSNVFASWCDVNFHRNWNQHKGQCLRMKIWLEANSVFSVFGDCIAIHSLNWMRFSDRMEKFRK